ncbi:MAG: hypothetical protein JOY90_38995 [Bradyrhizobium sp.]|uniref:hypothetical protein n=1 Tax=Bradyrhizobium sp. TaxID=376 RepID=UPI001DE16A3D|nr:hypothetical protein [Bradyrhizobium sp.]MBV9566390.1 hypothetical protein [Bradyrhizobium sp.]
MRILVMAAVLLAMLATPVAAQMGKRHGGGGGEPKSEQKPKVDERAYQDALKRIPEPKEKYDPWAVTKTPQQK